MNAKGTHKHKKKVVSLRRKEPETKTGKGREKSKRRTRCRQTNRKGSIRSTEARANEPNGEKKKESRM